MSEIYRVVKASEATSDDYAADYIPIQQVGPDVEGVDDVPVLWLIPDTTTQAIADAPRCEHDRIDKHDYQGKIEGGWHTMICEGAPELRDILDALTKDSDE